MDFSKNLNSMPEQLSLQTDTATATGAASATSASTTCVQGPELLQTVASMTGLPESLVSEELHEMLDMTGQCSSNVTLDGLRAAMLAYLESMQAEFEAEALADK